MKAKIENYYRSKKTGLPVFVYVVSGTEAELSAYKEAQEAVKLPNNKTAYVEDESGRPLYFSTRPLSTKRSESVELMITTNGRIVADDLDKVLTQQATLDDYILREQAKLMAMQAIGQAGVQAVADLTATRPVETAVHVAPEIPV